MGSSRSPKSEWDRPSAESRMNRFISAMPSSMCWPRRPEIPREGRGDALGLEQVLHLLAGKQAAPVHPGAEIGRHRHVGRRGDDPVGKRFVRSGEFVEDQPETLLGRHDWLIGRCEFRRHGDFRGLVTPGSPCIERHRSQEAPPARPRKGRAPRTGPIRGRGAPSRRRDSRPSGSASAAPRDCPCGRRAAGRSP